jgi:hypothetical protein
VEAPPTNKLLLGVSLLALLAPAATRSNPPNQPPCPADRARDIPGLLHLQPSDTDTRRLPAQIAWILSLGLLATNAAKYSALSAIKVPQAALHWQL